MVGLASLANDDYDSFFLDNPQLTHPLLYEPPPRPAGLGLKTTEALFPSPTPQQRQWEDQGSVWESSSSASNLPHTPLSPFDAWSPANIEGQIDTAISSHTHHFSNNSYLNLPPVDAAKQLGSSPHLLQESPFPSSQTPQLPASKFGPIPSSRTIKRSRTTGSTPNMSSNQRQVMGPPETPSRMNPTQQSPNMFPTLQFSPEMFSTGGFNPSMTSMLPQQRLFWDHPSMIPDMNANNEHFQDPFGLGRDDLNSSFTSTSTVVPAFDTLDSQQANPYDLPTLPRSASMSFIDGSVFPAPFQTSPRVVAVRNDNPSQFLSSPARRFGGTEPAETSANRRPIRDRPAYHHQIEESRREQETQRSRRHEPKHPSVSRSVMEALRRPVSPVKGVRPGMKRSLTYSGIGSQPHNARHDARTCLAENISNQSGRGGRASPLKSMIERGNRSVSSKYGSAAKRMALSLAIDENGVAKTVVTHPEEGDPDVDEDVDTESDSSSRDGSDFHAIHSQNVSFAYSDTGDFDNGLRKETMASLRHHSKNSSHSTMTSNMSGHQSSGSSSTGPVRSLSDEKAGGRTRHAPHRQSTLREDTIMEDIGRAGDAQSALRAIIEDRTRFISPQYQQGTQFHSSPPLGQSQFSTFTGSPNTITDPDLATPSTDRDSLASNGITRCICHADTPKSSGKIQCSSCRKWLHTACVGVDSKQRHRNAVNNYTCPFCTKPPANTTKAVIKNRSEGRSQPSAHSQGGSRPRHGSMRGGGSGAGTAVHQQTSSRSASHTHTHSQTTEASPLAHKSNRHR